jgi:hypothetical protein
MTEHPYLPTKAQISPPTFRPVMVKALFEGRKVATNRGKPLGTRGDWFDLTYVEKHPWGELRTTGHFKIVDVRCAEYHVVRDAYYQVEGFDSPEEFEKFGRSIYRGKLPNEHAIRYLHFLARVI